MKSNRKGKDGERELSKLLKAEGFDTRRGQQFCGKNGDADVVGLPGIHIECKRVEKLKLYDALAQSCSDARADETPVVMHRRNNAEWLITMKLKDWIQIYRGSDFLDEHERNKEETL